MVKTKSHPETILIHHSKFVSQTHAQTHQRDRNKAVVTMSELHAKNKKQNKMENEMKMVKNRNRKKSQHRDTVAVCQ